MSATAPKPDRLNVRILTPTSLLHMPVETIRQIFEIFVLDGCSPVVLTHINSWLREIALLHSRLWADIYFCGYTIKDYDYLRTLLGRTGTKCTIDIEFGFKFYNTSTKHAWRAEQFDRYYEEIRLHLSRIKRLTLSGMFYGSNNSMTTSFLFKVLDCATSLAHLDISSLERSIDWCGSPPAAMHNLERLILSTKNLDGMSYVSVPALKSLTILGRSKPPRFFEFLRLCSITLVDFTLDVGLNFWAEYDTPAVWLPSLRDLSIKIGSGENWWNKFDAPIIERVFFEFSQPRISSTLLQFLRHHSPSLKKISMRHEQSDMFTSIAFVGSIDIEPFSFPTLEELFMDLPYVGPVLGQIRSAPALMDLEIGPSPDTYDTPITSTPQIYPSLATISIVDRTDLLRLISAPALTGMTVSSNTLGDDPYFTDFLSQHADTILQLSVDSRENPENLLKLRNPNSAPPSEPAPLETLSFPCLGVLDVTLGGLMSKIQGAMMPELKQFTMRSHPGDFPRGEPSAPWNVNPSSFRAVSVLNIAGFPPTEPSLQLLRHLFDVSKCLSHITVRDTSIHARSTSIWVMNALAESRSCASLMAVDVVLPHYEATAPFSAALKRLDAHHDATTRKLGKVKLARCCVPDQETRSWLEEHVTELIFL